MESLEEHYSIIGIILSYICYIVILIAGSVNDILRPEACREKHRSGYSTLYASFDSFYIRHVIRKVRENWFIPVASSPGSIITLLERTTPDYGRTLLLTGKSKECINLGSYNYLGFAENSGVCCMAAVQAAKNFGLAVASSRLELGSLSIHIELERMTARFVGTEDAIVFGMGFATNVLNIPAILDGKDTLVLSDEKNHASIILGIRLSGVTVRLFQHNNVESLEQKLRHAIIYGQPRTRRPWRKVVIIVEGVYSMEGSIVPMPEIVTLKKKYGAYVYLDEAHSIGALGPQGRGVMDYFGLDPKEVDILMGTFTKSFGSSGGYIAGSCELINLVRRRSQGNYYGTAVSPPAAQQIITSMKIILGEIEGTEGLNRVRQLRSNSIYFRAQLANRGFRLYGNYDSPVVPLIAPMPTQVSYILSELIRKGVAAAGAIYPAVGVTESRVRFCLSASHSKENLDKAIDSMDRIGNLLYIKK